MIKYGIAFLIGCSNKFLVALAMSVGFCNQKLAAATN